MTGEQIGQPSMEELLASIRRIIAENETPPLSPDVEQRAPLHVFETRSEPPESVERATSHSLESSIDDSDDFELPAMFRQEKTEPLRDTGFVARLTEAIRGEPKPVSSPADGAAKTEAPLLPLPRRGDGSRLRDAPNGREATQDVPPLLSLREGEAPQRIEPRLDFAPPSAEPVTLSAPAPTPMMMPPPPEGLSRAAGEVRRVMAPCTDTLMARMGQRAVAPPQASPVPPVARGDNADDYCLGPSAFPRFDALPDSTTFANGQALQIPLAIMGARNFLIGGGAMDTPPGAAPNEAFLPPQLATPAPKRILPRIEDDQMPPGYIPESAAALLRPLLMQWLDDNMQRAFTKALHVEVAESGKDDKSYS